MIESWNKERWIQVFELESLLIECTSINSASGALPRLQRIMEAAEKLRAFDHVAPRQSFVSFLKNEALKHLPKETFETAAQGEKEQGDDTN